MPEIVPCPQCQRQLRIQEANFGQLVQCPACQFTFTAEPPPAVLPSEPPPPRPAALPPLPHAESGDLPSVVPAEFDFAGEATRPHRGTHILILAILGLIFGCVPFVGPLLGWCLGGLAWSMGANDVRLMAVGRMERAGRGLTEAGRFIGVFALIVASLACCIHCSAFLNR